MHGASIFGLQIQAQTDPIWETERQTTVLAGATVEEFLVLQPRQGEPALLHSFNNRCERAAAQDPDPWADIFFSVSDGGGPVSRWWNEFQGQRGLMGQTWYNLLYYVDKSGHEVTVRVRNAAAVDVVVSAEIIGVTLPECER